MAAELGIATAWIFTAFSAGLLVSAFLGPTAGRMPALDDSHNRLSMKRQVTLGCGKLCGV